jgi:hypothetical protein
MQRGTPLTPSKNKQEGITNNWAAFSLPLSTLASAAAPGILSAGRNGSCRLQKPLCTFAQNDPSLAAFRLESFAGEAGKPTYAFIVEDDVSDSNHGREVETGASQAARKRKAKRQTERAKRQQPIEHGERQEAPIMAFGGDEPDEAVAYETHLVRLER